MSNLKHIHISAEGRFKLKVIIALWRNVYPSAKNLGINPSSGLNGRQCKWRDQILEPWMKEHPDDPITLKRKQLMQPYQPEHVGAPWN